MMRRCSTGSSSPTGDHARAADLAAAAEAAGWDGVFTYDAIAIGDGEMFDPWILLAAMAMRTERVMLGAIVFAPAGGGPGSSPARRSTLDILSGGRLVLPVGLGTLDDPGSATSASRPTTRARAPAPRRDAGDRRRPVVGRAVRVRGRALPVRRDDLPADAGPAAADPGLGRGRVAARALDAAGRALGRRRRPGDRTGREPGHRPRGAARGRRWVPARPRPRGPRDGPFEIVVDGMTPAGDPAAAAATARLHAAAGATWWIEADWSAR